MTMIWTDLLCRFDYVVDPRRGDKFYAEIRKYYPDLPDEALEPGYSGMRPTLSGRGQKPADFLFQVRFTNTCRVQPCIFSAGRQ